MMELSPRDLNTEDIAREAIILDPGSEINVSQNPLNTYLADIDPYLTAPTNIIGLQTMDYRYNIRDWLIGINLTMLGLYSIWQDTSTWVAPSSMIYII